MLYSPVIACWCCTWGLFLRHPQGGSGISESTWGRFFFVRRPGPHTPPPWEKIYPNRLFQEKHVPIWEFSKNNMYRYCVVYIFLPGELIALSVWSTLATTSPFPSVTAVSLRRFGPRSHSGCFSKILRHSTACERRVESWKISAFLSVPSIDLTRPNVDSRRSVPRRIR